MPLVDYRSKVSYGTISQMDQYNDEEGEHLLQAGYEAGGHDSDVESSGDSIQEGVRKIEAINLTWTTRSLIIAYIRFVLLVFVEGD